MLQTLSALFRKARFRFGTNEPPRDGGWHPYSPILPVRLIDGRLNKASEPVWCRYDAPTGRWRFRQDDETLEDWADRNAW